MTRERDKQLQWRMVCDQTGCKTRSEAFAQQPDLAFFQGRGWFVAAKYGDVCPDCLARGVEPTTDPHRLLQEPGQPASTPRCRAEASRRGVGGPPMSDKKTCPGCSSHTSAVERAFGDGHPCPHCGLSNEAAEEIFTIRRAAADKAIQQRAEQAVRRTQKAEDERDTAQHRIAILQRLTTVQTEVLAGGYDHRSATDGIVI